MTFGVLQKYIFKEIILTLILILSILTLIFFLIATMQFVNKYSEYISFLDFIALVPYLIIKVIAFTIPLSILAATSLFYGRMAADREILILRSAGIHARNIFRPAFIVGGILALISLYINHELVPYSYIKQLEIRYKALEAILRANFSSKATTIDYIPNVRISYRELKDGRFQNLVIQSLDHNQIVSETLAESGLLIYDKNKKMLTFELKNGTFCHIPSHQSHHSREDRIFFQELSFPIPIEKSEKDEINYERAKYKQYKELIRDTEVWKNRMATSEHKLNSLQQNPDQDVEHQKNLALAKKEYAYTKDKYFTHVLVWHSRSAISLAPWVVVFLGVSLGLLVQHSNRLVAFAISAAPVIFIYYPIQMMGQYFAEKNIIPIWAGGWLGTIITGGIGIGLLLYVYRK